MFGERAPLAVLMLLALACFSCATSSYRIPGAEMQRLAATDVAKRGAFVRVVPVDESTRALAAVPAAPVQNQATAAPSTTIDGPMSVPTGGPAETTADRITDTTVDDDMGGGPSEIMVEPRVFIEGDVVAGGERPSGRRPAIRPTSPPPFQPPARPPAREAPIARGTAAPAPGNTRPVFTPIVRTASSGGGAGVGIGGGRSSFSPPRAAPPIRGGAVGSAAHMVPTSGAARTPSLPARGGGGGGHSSSSSSGAGEVVGVIAVVAAIVIVVAIVAAIAEASQPLPPFDGWVALQDRHPLHLRYDHRVERLVPLRELRPFDLIGLRDTIVTDSDGTIQRLNQAMRQ